MLKEKFNDNYKQIKGLRDYIQFIHVIQMFTYYTTIIICTKEILKFLNLVEGVKELSTQDKQSKSKILHLEKQGTPLQNEIQFQFAKITGLDMAGMVWGLRRSVSPSLNKQWEATPLESSNDPPVFLVNDITQVALQTMVLVYLLYNYVNYPLSHYYIGIRIPDSHFPVTTSLICKFSNGNGLKLRSLADIM